MFSPHTLWKEAVFFFHGISKLYYYCQALSCLDEMLSVHLMALQFHCCLTLYGISLFSMYVLT